MTARITVFVEHGDGRITRWVGHLDNAGNCAGDADPGYTVLAATGWRHTALADPRTPEPAP